MDKAEFYTKGEREEVLSRIGQVHTITLFCPMSDACVQGLRNTFELMLPQYKSDDNLWKDVPAIDALNVFICNHAYQESFESDLNMDIMEIMMSSLKLFKRLKYISFKFTDDEYVAQTYQYLIERNKEKVLKRYIYNVDILEFNLCDLFSQKVIDLLNKILIFNEQMPNSYLDRKFKLDFKYDEYISFISMFLNNNKDDLNKVDKNIYDYFALFPRLIKEQKPDIRLLTNYSD